MSYNALENVMPQKNKAYVKKHNSALKNFKKFLKQKMGVLFSDGHQ